MVRRKKLFQSHHCQYVVTTTAAQFKAFAVGEAHYRRVLKPFFQRMGYLEMREGIRRSRREAAGSRMQPPQAREVVRVGSYAIGVGARGNIPTSQGACSRRQNIRRKGDRPITTSRRSSAVNRRLRGIEDDLI